MSDSARAFVRGYAAAVAGMVRHQVNAGDLLRSISATEQLLRDSGVEEYDLAELKPWLTNETERPPESTCSAESPCCPRRDEYNGFASDGPTIFECPKHCPCHD